MATGENITVIRQKIRMLPDALSPVINESSPNNPPIPTAGYLEEITCDQPQLQFAVSGVDLPGIAVVAEAPRPTWL